MRRLRLAGASAALVVLGLAPTSCGSESARSQGSTGTTSASTDTGGTTSSISQLAPCTALPLDAPSGTENAIGEVRVTWLDEVVGEPIVPLRMVATGDAAVTVVGTVALDGTPTTPGNVRPHNRLHVTSIAGDGSTAWQAPLGERLPLWFNRTVPLQVQALEDGRTAIAWPRPLGPLPTTADADDDNWWRASSDPSELVLTVLDREGKVETETVVEADPAATVAIAADGGLATISPDGQLAVHDEDGSVRWQHSYSARYDGPVWWNTPNAPRAVVTSDCVYAVVPTGAGYQDPWDLVALDRTTGSESWSHVLAGTQPTALATASGMVLVGTPGSPWMEAFTPSGDVAWSAGAERGNNYPIAITSGDQLLVLANSEGTDTSEYVVWGVSADAATAIGSFGLCCGIGPGTSASDLVRLGGDGIAIAGTDRSSSEHFFGDDEPVGGGFLLMLPDANDLTAYMPAPWFEIASTTSSP